MSVWPLAAVYGWVLSQGGGCDHAVGITGHRPAESDNGDSEQTWMHTRGAELMGDVCSDQAGHDPGKASEVMQPSPLHLCVPAGLGQEKRLSWYDKSPLGDCGAVWGYEQCYPVHASKLITVQGNEEVM